ncbi:hypothetical protein [Streptomyces sp. NPDC005009]
MLHASSPETGPATGTAARVYCRRLVRQCSSARTGEHHAPIRDRATVAQGQRARKSGDGVHHEQSLFSYNGLCEVIVLAARGKVRLRTGTYSLGRSQDVLNDLDAGGAILVP